MSKARLIITAVVVEGRTQAEVACTYSVSKGWVSKLIARYKAEGEAAFEARSRRPKSSPNRAAVPPPTGQGGLVTPEPKKRSRASYVRFQAEMPNETWQSDFTHYRLADGVDVEILSWLDDCTRHAVRVTAHPRVTTPIVLAEFRQAVKNAGIPASTDNGMVFTVRLAGIGRQGGRNSFENELRRLHIIRKNGKPNRPTRDKTRKLPNSSVW